MRRQPAPRPRMQGIEEPAKVFYWQTGEEVVHESPVAGKRPGEARQRHDEEEQRAVKAQRDVAVVPKPPPSFRAGYLQAVLQRAAVSRKPNYHSTYQDDDHRHGRDTHHRLSSRWLSLLGRRVEHPAMQGTYLAEKFGALFLAMLPFCLRCLGFGIHHLCYFLLEHKDRTGKANHRDQDSQRDGQP